MSCPFQNIQIFSRVFTSSLIPANSLISCNFFIFKNLRHLINLLPISKKISKPIFPSAGIWEKSMGDWKPSWNRVVVPAHQASILGLGSVLFLSVQQVAAAGRQVVGEGGGGGGGGGEGREGGGGGDALQLCPGPLKFCTRVLVLVRICMIFWWIRVLKGVGHLMD
jgi:hypothetical protein